MRDTLLAAGLNFIADDCDEVLTTTRENLRAGTTQIKVMNGGDGEVWKNALVRAPGR
jgi:hypothetical protein